MGIDIDSFYLPIPIILSILWLFFSPFWNLFFFERQLFLLFSLLKISAAYIDFLSILHALKQLESLNQLFYFQLLYVSIYKFNST